MSERMVTANGVPLCVETFGDPADPALLLIHGAQASMLWWEEELCSLLAAGGRYVVRYDQRDTGRSVSYPVGEPPYAMSDLARDAVGVLDALGIDRAHVVGRSMNGGTALFLGVDHPERVATLTFVTTTTGEVEDGGDVAEEPGGAPTEPAKPATVVDELVEAIRECAGRSPYFDEAAVRTRAERDVARATDMAASLTNHFAMRFDEPKGGGWGDLAAPALVVQGELDPYFPPKHGEALAAAIPDAELLVLEDVGHDVPPESWDVFVPALLRHTHR
ncbi:alpha/beta fold hydrolase [Nocardioides speluncae]|uniref:alpha/beta fold hydrolase n=1 Tax=Nocardioides speluncae TaxID=2670337 RepID=UPI000D685678|nr:alpha/beta hydrolase [Nocardioides speluncae]